MYQTTKKEAMLFSIMKNTASQIKCLMVDLLSCFLSLLKNKGIKIFHPNAFGFSNFIFCDMGHGHNLIWSKVLAILATKFHCLTI